MTSLSEPRPPRWVGIETINTCNARCPFCPLFQGDSPMLRDIRPAKIMSDELFDSIISQVAGWEHQPSAIFLNMNGEPLQDPKFVSRCGAIKKFGLGPKIELQTNAHFLGPAHREAILDAGVGRLVIGFDGATPAVYEAHRVRCDYDRVLDNIKAFVKLRASRGAKTRIAIQYVRTTQNQHEVVPAWRMFGQILDPELDVFQHDVSKDWGDTPGPDSYFVLPKRTTPAEVADCQLAAEQFIINSDGKVQSCCWDYNLAVSEGGSGDASVQPLLDIWYSQRRAEMMARINHVDPKSRPDKCVHCEYSGARPLPPEFKSDLPEQFQVQASPYGHVFRFPRVSETALT